MNHHRDTTDEHVRRLPLVSDEQVRLLSDSEAKTALFEEITTMAPDIHTTPPAPGRGHVPRRAIALAAAVLAVASAFVVPLVLGGNGNAAYAVTRQPDGTVRVEINEFRDAEGLQQRLAEEGIPVHVDRVPEGYTCDRHDLRHGPELNEERRADGSVVFTLDPANYDSGARLLIEAEEADPQEQSFTVDGGSSDGPRRDVAGEGQVQLHFYTVDGEVGDCELVRNERVYLDDPPSDHHGDLDEVELKGGHGGVIQDD